MRFRQFLHVNLEKLRIRPLAVVLRFCDETAVLYTVGSVPQKVHRLGVEQSAAVHVRKWGKSQVLRPREERHVSTECVLEHEVAIVQSHFIRSTQLLFLRPYAGNICHHFDADFFHLLHDLL